MTQAQQRPLIAIAGATGFIGKALRRQLTDTCDIRVLTRSPLRAKAYADSEEHVTWRHCDLFYVGHVERELEGVDVAIYLVHSQLPSSRLTQAEYRDLDLLIADNFARAAERAGVKQLITVGVTPPEVDQPGDFLETRLEIQRTLASHRTPLTVLRAGLVVGAGGTSVNAMIRLVRQTPVLLMPSWTHNRLQPLALDDYVAALKACILNEAAYGQSIDMPGPESMSFADFLRRAADCMKLRRGFVFLPLRLRTISRLWFRTVAGASDEVAGLLVDSLSGDQESDSVTFLPKAKTPLGEGLKTCLDQRGRPAANPRNDLRRSEDRQIREDRLVRSVQRLPLPRGYSARDVAEEYPRWVPGFVGPFLRCDIDSEAGTIIFRNRLPSMKLLELAYDPQYSTPDRCFYRIIGGALVHRKGIGRGRLEFREVLNGTHVITAIHDFRPRLPWYFYNATQAVVHLWVMLGFGRYLRRHPGNMQESH